jgi:hypothetical protein
MLLWCGTFVFAAGPDAGRAPGRNQATALNTKGFREYQAGRFPEALKLFLEATKADPTHALAEYNVAATLGVLRKKNGACEYEAFKQSILKHLTKAVELDPGRRERMKADPDLDTVRDTVGYQKLLGVDPRKPEDLPTLLEQVSWFGPGTGVYGSMVGIDFQPSGHLELWHRKVEDTEGNPVKTLKVRGSWKTEGSTVYVHLSSPLEGKMDLKATLTEDGALDFGTPELMLRDSPSECDA